MNPRKRRPTPATVISLVALFVALGGTAFALQRNSIASRHIVNGKVKAADLGQGSVKSRHVGRDALTGADIREKRLDQPLDDLTYKSVAVIARANDQTTVTIPCPDGQLPITGGFDGLTEDVFLATSRPFRPLSPRASRTAGATSSSTTEPRAPRHRRGRLRARKSRRLARAENISAASAASPTAPPRSLERRGVGVDLLGGRGRRDQGHHVERGEEDPRG